MSSPGSMHETGRSGPVHWEDPEGWDGEGGRRGLQDEGAHVHLWLIMSLSGKNHYYIVK